ncbi:hypothetical protein J3P71_28505 (plasmid) [Rhizobium leguminosarum]|uniref:hypothetical protein n=1 Tax=Rhizobium leguminosarum TaxID=384 RepID=UPI0014416B3F|nr:hypothetical protein [Rhizobium leguminosarum]MBY5835282.1 hypothetical protein [Rhizobium leguminosarum]NKM80582.1 hypothetical protein [Rhizobium leguminosarum bv. viciae]QSZ11553.1 hypothetical protein J3P71_28505 [Rhizobium leguminosarum]
MIALFSSEYCCSAGATAGKNNELTITEALRDPLIAIVMRADGVTSEEFKQLLEAAARELKANLASHQPEERRRDCRNDTEDG